MKKYKNQFPVAMMSKVLGISKSGYYKWLKIEPKKSLRSRQLDEQVKSAFSKNHMVYGSSRIAQYLEENNTVTYSRTTVARCMQRLNLVARPKRKFVVARDSDHDFKIADNLLVYNGAHLTPRLAQADPLEMAQADPSSVSSGFQR